MNQEIVAAPRIDLTAVAPYRPGLSFLLGIVAPLVAIAAQSTLGDMRLELPGLRFLNLFPLFSYGVVAMEMLTLAVWLKRGGRLGRWTGFVAGVLLAGSLFAGLLGLVLLPFSMIGLLVGIGVLGFVPLATCYVFFRNGVIAYHSAAMGSVFLRVEATVILGGVLVFAIPGVAQSTASLAVRAAVRGVGNGDPHATAKLQILPAFLYRDRLVWAYQWEHDAIRRDRLARAFKALCGEDIESRLWRLND
jgi:hypothetical protein